MKKITSFNIDTSDLAATASSKQYTISGEKDAEFILQVFDTPSGSSDPVAFYDFVTKSFSITQTSTSSLSVKMKGSSYSGSIDFPANASGDTYTILLLTPPDKDTELDFGLGKNSYSTAITQVADADLILTTVSGTSAAYGTPPTVTSTISSAVTSAVSKTIDWTLTNSETEANGFGLRLTRQPIDTDWYFTTTDTVDGAISIANDVVTVDSLTDLTEGMYITNISAGGNGATPIITAIDTNSNELQLSGGITADDGATLTFQARGSSVIQKAIGVSIDFSNFNSSTTSATAGPTPFTKTTRATGTNKVIALTDTYGLHGDGHLIFSGLNVVNTDANTVESVVIDVAAEGGLDNDGTITVEVNQTADLAVGTTLYFKSISAGETFGTQVEISNTVIITTHPSTARTIYLNLDNFITLGTAS